MKNVVSIHYLLCLQHIAMLEINEKYEKMLSKLEMRFGTLRGTLLSSILEGFGVPLGSLGASLWEKRGSGKASKKGAKNGSATKFGKA